jgi:membrane protein DedA with SNARE-associated domain
MIESFCMWLVDSIGALGYLGILLLMFLESTFFPVPSELVIPPAGYLAAKNGMNLGLITAAGVSGSVLGATLNYWLAFKLGRPFFEKYGHYFLVSRRSLRRADEFFFKHGHISTFIGRLLPVIRHLISLPAGLARMDFLVFCIFTTLGSGIWVVILAGSGYWLGYNQELVRTYLHWITLAMILSCALLAAGYYITWVCLRARDR